MNEKPEADKELNEEYSALKHKQTVNSGVNQEDISKEKNSSLEDKHADDDGVNEGEVTWGAEGENEKRLSNSSSCSKADLKSEATNCSVDQTTMEEKR